MALMSFREPNVVKWIGTRPAHSWTQIAKGAQALNATVVIHTVTAGKTLFLVESLLALITGSSGIGLLWVRDGADALVRYLGWAAWGAGLMSGDGHFQPMIPYEIPAGYDICCSTSAATLTCHGNIFGGEE